MVIVSDIQSLVPDVDAMCIGSVGTYSDLLRKAQCGAVSLGSVCVSFKIYEVGSDGHKRLRTMVASPRRLCSENRSRLLRGK